MGKHKRLFQRFLLVAGLFAYMACTAGVVFAQNVTQGYQSDQALQKGMIVRLKRGDSTKVEALNQKEVAEMLGVVVASSDAPVSLSTSGVDQEVFVATFGQYDVLVSTQNGPIKEGDFVTISSLSGVGMKASDKQQLVVGKALRTFDDRSEAESVMTLETNKGKKEVRLGRVVVEVSVAHNPLYEDSGDTAVPKFLAKAVGLVTDRPTSAFRIYASLAAAVFSIIIAGSILYAGVRSGMTAVGRNPLARHSIFRNLIQVTLMALIVFVIGVFAVYLLLRI
ncbi:MAG: hypothetical protein AAB834_06095 [Patescibacteria group bacterium]